jgi:hypothetical protein
MIVLIVFAEAKEDNICGNKNRAMTVLFKGIFRWEFPGRSIIQKLVSNILRSAVKGRRGFWAFLNGGARNILRRKSHPMTFIFIY